MLRHIIFLAVLLTAQQINAQPSAGNSHRAKQEGNTNSVTTPLNNAGSRINDERVAESRAANKERGDEEQAFKTAQLQQNQTIADATNWIAIFGGLSFLAAFIYSIVAGFQLAEMRRVFALTERPSLGITITRVEERVIEVVVENSGRTPARQVLIFLHPKFYRLAELRSDFPEPVETDPAPKNEKTRGFIPIGHRKMRTLPIPADQAIEIGQAVGVLFIWVYVSYEGLTGKNYFVEGYLRVANDAIGTISCRTHNDGN